MSGQAGSGEGAGQGGDSGSGLPPQAPAYDFRTGEPLDAPRPASAPVVDADFTASELGIWAPSGKDEQAGSPGFAAGIPAQFGPSVHQPTPPPEATYGSGYGPGPTSVAPPQTPGYRPSSPGFPPPGYPPGYAPTAQQPAAPPPSRRGPVVAAGVIGVLVVVVAVLVAVLAFGGSSKTPVASTSDGGSTSNSGQGTTGQGTTGQGSTGQGTTGQSGSTGQGSTGGSTTGSSPGGGSTDPARLAFLRTVDGILTQSASGRQQVSSVVNGVVNGCSVTPENASATIRQVIVNRQSVLGQANALTAPDAATAAVKADLVRALSASIDANRGYQRWLDNLYATYFNAQPVGCPDGQAPTDANYDAATAASGRATTAKQSFVAAYNPLATPAGLRTWQESEF